MKIFISNDDGYKSEGIQALFRALKEAKHEVIMVAPDRERSTISHALTLHKPLRLFQYDEDQWILNGTPADCIFVAMRHKWRFKPELVISGINRGANLGTDVHYSGTVSCARESVLCGVPALATSLVLDHTKTPEEVEALQKQHHYEDAARLVVDVLPKIVELKKFTNRLLNLNIPNCTYDEVKGVRLATLGDRIYDGDVEFRTDPRGREYLWGGGVYSGYTSIKGSDNTYIADGYATLTPITLDATDYSLLDEMKSWEIEQ